MQLLSALKVMQARGKSKLLSSPSVTTLDNHEASTSTTTTVYVSGQVAEENIKEDNNENLGFFGKKSLEKGTKLIFFHIISFF